MRWFCRICSKETTFKELDHLVEHVLNVHGGLGLLTEESGDDISDSSVDPEIRAHAKIVLRGLILQTGGIEIARDEEDLDEDEESEEDDSSYEEEE